MTDLQTLKATAQATAEKSPELLVTVPAGVMVGLIRDVERYRWLREMRHGPALAVWRARRNPLTGKYLDDAVDSAIAKEAQ